MGGYSEKLSDVYNCRSKLLDFLPDLADQLRSLCSFSPSLYLLPVPTYIFLAICHILQWWLHVSKCNIKKFTGCFCLNLSIITPPPLAKMKSFAKIPHLYNDKHLSLGCKEPSSHCCFTSFPEFEQSECRPVSSSSFSLLCFLSHTEWLATLEASHWYLGEFPVPFLPHSYVPDLELMKHVVCKHSHIFPTPRFPNISPLVCKPASLLPYLWISNSRWQYQLIWISSHTTHRTHQLW